MSDETAELFAPSQEREALRDAVRSWCDRRRPADVVADWSSLASLDTVGLAVPTEQGGSGAGLAELAVVAEELGRALLPLPWADTAVVAIALTSMSDEAFASVVADVIAGRYCVALLPLWTTAQRDGDGWVLDTKAAHVVGAQLANRVAVRVETDSSTGIALVDPTAEGVEIISEDALDPGRPQATVRLSGARAEVVVPTAVDPGDLMPLLIAAESLGIASRMLDTTVEHARTRLQFGRPIGSFQAVSHRCADMFIALEHARSTVENACWFLDTRGEGAAAAVALAHWTAVTAAREITAAAIQLHGGMGVTWEHPAHRYYKRALVNAQLWGGGQRSREMFGSRLVGL